MKNKKVLKPIILMLSYFLFPFVFGFIFSHFKIFRSNELLLETICSLMLFITLIIILRKSLKEEFKTFKDNIKFNIKSMFKYWFLGLLIMFVSNGILTSIIGQIPGNEEAVREMIHNYPIISGINVILLAPFIEEITFRYSLKDSFKNKYIYAFVSAFIFGLLHVIVGLDSPIKLLFIIPYGALGFVFARLYSETNTSFSNIFMHLIHNMIMFFTILLFI